MSTVPSASAPHQHPAARALFSALRHRRELTSAQAVALLTILRHVAMCYADVRTMPAVIAVRPESAASYRAACLSPVLDAYNRQLGMLAAEYGSAGRTALTPSMLTMLAHLAALDEGRPVPRLQLLTREAGRALVALVDAGLLREDVRSSGSRLTDEGRRILAAQRVAAAGTR